jgi:hypothetical protein
MIHTSTPQSVFKVAMVALAATTSLLTACGEPPVVVGNPADAKLNAIAVTEISPNGSSTSDISLSWSDIPSSAKSLKFFRRKSGDDLSSAEQLEVITDTSKSTLKDGSPSLQSDVDYIYSIRADNANNISVASAQSEPIRIISASSVEPFSITVPAANNMTLKDPLGTGHQFSWADAGTGLYHVRVTDATGKILWGAITKNTTISYGTASGTERKEGSAVSGPMDPNLEVPLALTNKLVISSARPDPARNEVALVGIGSTAGYTIQVSAIETRPTKGNLKTANSIAIRKAQEVRFVAQ